MQFLNLIQPQSGASETQAATSVTLIPNDPNTTTMGQGFGDLMKVAKPQTADSALAGETVEIQESVMTHPLPILDESLIFQQVDSEDFIHVPMREPITDLAGDEDHLEHTLHQQTLAATPAPDWAITNLQAETAPIENVEVSDDETTSRPFVPLEMTQSEPSIPSLILSGETPKVPQDVALKTPSSDTHIDPAGSQMMANVISAPPVEGFVGKAVEKSATAARLIPSKTPLEQAQLLEIKPDQAQSGMGQSVLSDPVEAPTNAQKTAAAYETYIRQAATTSELGAKGGADAVTIPTTEISNEARMVGQVNDKPAPLLEPSKDIQTQTAPQMPKPSVTAGDAASPLPQAVKSSVAVEAAVSVASLEIGETKFAEDAKKSPSLAQPQTQSSAHPNPLANATNVTQQRPVAAPVIPEEPSTESPVSNDESLEISASPDATEAETQHQTTTVPTAAERNALLYANVTEGAPQKLGPLEGASAFGLEASSLIGGYESVSARLEQISQTDQLTQTNRVELPARLAAQIADVARQLPDGPIEISLSPEELGKVKLTFQVSENGAMNVVVAAERAETLEFMKRNVDSLLAEFSDLGYEGSSFQFQQDGQNANGDEAEQFGSSKSGTLISDADDSAVSTTTNDPSPVRLHLDGTSGMDLRL